MPSSVVQRSSGVCIAARFLCPKFQRQHMNLTRIFEKKEGSFSAGHTVVAGRGYAAAGIQRPYRHPADRFFPTNSNPLND
jgi:hypothetical protein